MTSSEFAAAIQAPTLITATQASQLLGISKSSFYRLVADGRYPRPVHLGTRLSRWHADQIMQLAQTGLQPVTTTPQQQ